MLRRSQIQQVLQSNAQPESLLSVCRGSAQGLLALKFETDCRRQTAFCRRSRFSSALSEVLRRLVRQGRSPRAGHPGKKRAKVGQPSRFDFNEDESHNDATDCVAIVRSLSQRRKGQVVQRHDSAVTENAAQPTPKLHPSGQMRFLSSTDWPVRLLDFEAPACAWYREPSQSYSVGLSQKVEGFGSLDCVAVNPG